MSDKVTVADNLEKYGSKTAFIPSQEEASLMVQAYTDFIRARNVRQEPQDILGGQSWDEFWDQCNYDYNVITEVQD